jgi:aryl-alcohol dehydrogenase-like predicted oxidoreductase
MEKHPYETLGPIPRRRLGKTDVEVSAIGVGGHHLGDLPDVDHAVELVHEAIDAGITFFDCCWEYYDGKSEDWLGRALAGKRDKVFLMTKVCTHGRDGALGLRMLEESLRRLMTDHLDLWQIHGVSFDDDPDLAYRKGGVIEALDAAKRAGKVRFVGFTGHKDPSIHLRMLELGYPFDTVQMPLNCFDATFRSFEQRVLPEAIRRGVAPIGMKSLGGTAQMILRGDVTHEDALRYAMSLPVLTTVAGMSSIDVLRSDLLVARGFQPMSQAQMDALRAACAPRAADGRYELYKISLSYDNPEARLAHGYPDDPLQKEIAQTYDELMGETSR